LPSLQAARRSLGLERQVTDSQLQASLTMRPYAAAEQLLAGALQLGGVDPRSSEASSLVSRPSDVVAQELVARIAARTHASVSETRDALGAELGQVLGRHVN
jgi:hypothetical protein